MRKYYLLTLITFLSFNIHAQRLAIGQWSEHLPYIHARTIAEGGDKIFCATDDGLFAYHKDDNSLQRFSKLSGLNDFGVATIEYSTDYKTLIIAYTNSNIDLVKDDGGVFNLSDIKRKNIPGNKEINNIRVNGRYAFLSCGFGIVVIDLLKQEIKDTYHVNVDSINNNVYEVVSDANWFYAATDSGIYRALVNDPNLNSYFEWSKVFTQSGYGHFSFIESYSNLIIANFMITDVNGSYQSDAIFSSADGINWITNVPPLSGNGRNYSFRVSNNLFIVTNSNSVRVFDSNFNQLQSLDGNIYADPKTRDAFKDAQQNLWVADNSQGLIKWTGQSPVEKIHPDGPISSLVSDLGLEKNILWVTHSVKDPRWNNGYGGAAISKLQENKWYSFNSSNVPAFAASNFFDDMTLAVDPNDPQHVFIGSAGSGLMDFYNDNARTFYRDTNSTLLQMVGNSPQVKVHGLRFDNLGNLWMANSGVSSFINVLLANGQWKRFDFPVFGNAFAGGLFVDSYNQIWVQIYGNSNNHDGLLVFNPNNTFDNLSDDQTKLLIDSAGYGNLPDRGVYCMTEDLENQLWLGTGKGIGVVYSPSAVFSTVDPCQKILIKQDNTYQYLLATEVVTAIAVDGSNRKWIGTTTSGIYLFSSDGQQEIHHFTPDNSPLFSVNITAIAIDKNSGEVFIGTDKGLVSYQSDAILGDEKCKGIIVYPNPVRESYTGPIAIKGVVSNSNIKITDVSGTLVYEGKALGGQAVWNGLNFEGKRAQTGVYLVFSTDDTGTNSCVTKLLLVN